MSNLITMNGKFNTATIFTDLINSTVREQIKELLNNPIYEGDFDIKIMPDCHAGKDCLIGFTMPVKDKIDPHILGSDIGCGVTCFTFRERMKYKRHLKDYNDIARATVMIDKSLPGSKGEKEFFPEGIGFLSLYKKIGFSIDKAKETFATLGGGNHFLELAQDEEQGFYAWVVHSGSRALGGAVFKYWEHIMKKMPIVPPEVLEGIKMTFPKYMWETRIELFKKNNKNLKYLYGDLKNEYIHDVETVTTFARKSRVAMLYNISDLMKLHWSPNAVTDCAHNTILDGIIRKGAIPAKRNEMVLIPMNMQYGTLVGVGLGNKEWNLSAPHGAGRVLSRSQAKAIITDDEARLMVGDIYSDNIPVDECPAVYKEPEKIIEQMKDSVRVTKRLLPLVNIKG